MPHRPNGIGAVDIDNQLQKSRNQAKLSLRNNPALPNGLDRRLPSRRASRRQEKARENSFSEKSA
jgi:hypothetical protein